jgi:hypothetical protein
MRVGADEELTHLPENADPISRQGYGCLCWVPTYPCWGSLAPAGRGTPHRANTSVRQEVHKGRLTQLP